MGKEARDSAYMLRRYQLNKIVVDTEAGPHRNRTVLFLGSSRGTILKFLIVPNQDNTVTNSNIFLEELEGFNPDKYEGWWMCVWEGGDEGENRETTGKAITGNNKNTCLSGESAA